MPSLRAVYQAVIDAAGSSLAHSCRQLPGGPTIALMKLAHKLGVSPLGPYHYRMIAEDFIFDTRHIRQQMDWRPTLTNQDMMIKAYQYYSKCRIEIDGFTRAGEVLPRPLPADG